jgi:hypothetical protein
MAEDTGDVEIGNVQVESDNAEAKKIEPPNIEIQRMKSNLTIVQALVVKVDVKMCS